MRPAKRHHSHTVYVNGMLSRAIRHPLPSLHDTPLPPWIVIPDPVESGRVEYAAGDLYHIGVTFVGMGFPTFDELGRNVTARLGDYQASNNSDGAPNVRLEDVVPIIPPNLSEQAEALRGMSHLTLQFVTPLHISQKFRTGSPRRFDREYFDVAHFFQTLDRRLYDISKLGPDTPGPLKDKEPPNVNPVTNRLVWMRVPSPDDRPDKPLYYGAVGKVVLEGDFSGWEDALVRGQYVRLGKSTNFGFGKYLIRELDPIRKGDIKPARDFLSAAASKTNLHRAWEIAKAKGGCAGADGKSLDDFEENAEGRIEVLAGEVSHGSYAPSPLLGVVIGREKGHPRALAIPTVRDRVAQKSAVQALGPSIDKLFEDSSYAYRKGHSRFDAVGAIERAYRDGYRYALRADVESFFDSVDWDRLRDKLEAFFPREPLVDLMMQWVKSPVVYQGRTISRTRGLPQGAPISPMLANLYLDEFDEEMEELGFRYVRYADDFIILCKSATRAREAREAAREALADLGLKLNVEKTTVTDFDHGFRYLGFLFLRSMALESHQPSVESDAIVIPPPQASWMAGISNDSPVPLSDEPRENHRLIGQLVDASKNAPEAGDKCPLYIDSPDLQVRSVRGMLLITGNTADDKPVEYPFDRLSHIVVNGRTRMTLPTLLKANDCGVPVFITRASGELRAIYDPRPTDWRILQDQATFLSNTDAISDFSRQIVKAKLHNQAETLRSRRDNRLAPSVDAIQTLERSCNGERDVDSLRGLEGRGAVEFFKGVSILLDSEWRFTHRIKHPPTDPVNALLSYGYTLLYYRCSAALQMNGLNPHLGLFHRPSDRFHALAADLQEEFRHIADSVVLRLIRKGEIRVEDFNHTPDGKSCLMLGPARKKFIRTFEERLKTSFRLPGATESSTYRHLLEQQARQIRALIRGRVDQYSPIRVH